MRGTTLIYFSCGALLAALSACALAGYLAWNVSTQLSTREALESSSNTQSAQEENAVQLSTLANDTEAQRTQLVALVGTDVVGIANMIESAGHAAGVSTSIAAASSATAPPGSPAGLNALDFIAETDGTFTQVFRAAQLFQTLPLPSSVEELDFEYTPSQGTSSQRLWQLTARIQVLTDSDVSS